MRRYGGLPLILIGLLILGIAVAPVRGQGLYEVSFDEKVTNSSLIVEGKVVGNKSFWNEGRTMIFTANQIEVYKIFKGDLQKDTIEVVTLGGTVDNYCIRASHLLSLENGDLGVFFCQNSSTKMPAHLSGVATFDVYSSSQGFFRYDLVTKRATAPFVRYNNISKDLYGDLNRKTGRATQIRNRRFDIEKLKPVSGADVQHNTMLAPVISSFTPATVNAGALSDPENNVLTIKGSGFGSTPSGDAAILFSDADEGAGNFHTIAYNNGHVVSWKDTEIKVMVPTKAGTGIFRVRDNAGATVNSAQPLIIRFSIITGEFGEHQFKQFNLVNSNGNGGYDIKYSTSTANGGANINSSPAKATFQRALNTWKQTTGVNFNEAGTTSLQTVNTQDGENIIMFDNGGKGSGYTPLSAGVLATCFSGAQVCGGATNAAHKTGFDIVLRNEGYSSGSTPFTFGPCPPYSSSTSEVDLETVLLHELGHALNLGHIIDPLEGTGAGTSSPAKVMHYSVTFNQRRISLDYAAMAGAAYQLTDHNYSYGNCLPGSPEMIPLTTLIDPKDECPVDFPVNVTPLLSTVNFDLEHTTSNKFVDPAYNQTTPDGSGSGVTNTAFYAIRTNNKGGSLDLEVRNYVTGPVTIAACTPGSAGVPVSGVKLAVYKLTSCPEGGSFPAPIAYTTFNTDGLLAPITSLSANTNYLLVADGIQNTKANFDLVFSGSALIVNQIDITGNTSNTFNTIKWVTDAAFDISIMTLERSANETTGFVKIADIADAQDWLQGEYVDEAPLPGDNYYRIVIREINDLIQYSKVLLLSRGQVRTVNVYPNPATQTLNVQIINREPGKYVITLHNSLGQLVIEKEVSVTGSNFIEALPVYKLPRGIYHLTVYGQDRKRIESSNVKLK